MLLLLLRQVAIQLARLVAVQQLRRAARRREPLDENGGLAARKAPRQSATAGALPQKVAGSIVPGNHMGPCLGRGTTPVKHQHYSGFGVVSTLGVSMPN
jgi:hypothetical protein